MENNIEKENFFTAILAVAVVIISSLIISKLLKDLKKSNKDDIVSEEGQNILSDPKKRVILRNAIEQYHQKGNWDGLNNLKS